MPNSLRVLVILASLALSACGSVGPEMSGAAAATQSQASGSSAMADTATPVSAPTVAVSPTPASTPILPPLNNAAIQAQIDRMASSFLGQGQGSALGVGVVLRNPQTNQLEALLLNYGTPVKDNGQAVTSSTIYEIGSITKVFTGILLAEAVSAGAVQLNDPIQQYLPAGIQAPTYRNQPITLAELATHRSSLPRNVDSDSLPDLYNWLNAYQLARPPGSQYAYSNMGYALLGDILARLAGMDYGTLEFQAVSQPLGLLDTRETLSADQTSRLAQGYNYGGSAADEFPVSGAMSGAGALRSTLYDMTRFLIANMQLDSTSLMPSISLAQSMQAEGANPGTGVGLGWDIDQPGSTRERISKGGGTSGFTSYISFMGDGSSGFVLLSNGMYVETLVTQMLHILSSAQ